MVDSSSQLVLYNAKLQHQPKLQHSLDAIQRCCSKFWRFPVVWRHGEGAGGAGAPGAEPGSCPMLTWLRWHRPGGWGHRGWHTADLGSLVPPGGGSVDDPPLGSGASPLSGDTAAGLGGRGPRRGAWVPPHAGLRWRRPGGWGHRTGWPRRVCYHA